MPTPPCDHVPPDHDPAALVLREDAGPDAVTAVNDFLIAETISGRIESPLKTASPVPVVRVSGVCAKDARDAIRSGRGRGVGVPNVGLVYRYLGGTYQLLGRAWGHGFQFFEFSPSSDPPAAPKWPTPLPGGRRRPVIALLDSGVKAHRWLPEDTPGDRFVEDIEFPHDPLGDPDLEHEAVQMATGHATFIAGLIRREAPDARIMSMRVMREDGVVNETTVIDALTFLLDNRSDGMPVDVVCMAFGRPVADADLGEQELQSVKDLLSKLAHAGVRLVASAGNDGSTEKVYPAAFAEEFALDSVGAGWSPTDHAPYSNHGEWVHGWCDGSNMVSTMPRDSWAWWSGTSFAAARWAAHRAAAMVV